MLVLFVLHSAVMFVGQYWYLKHEVPKIALQILPAHLMCFDDVTKLASALKLFIRFKPYAIYWTLNLWFFYF